MDNRLMGLGMGIVVLVVVLAIGAYVTSQIGTQIAATAPGSTAYNVTTTGTSAIGTLANWIPILVIAAVAAVVLAYFIGGFGIGGKK